MAAIYLQHPVHGHKVATGESEAVYDEGNGWERYDLDSPDEPVKRRGRPPKELPNFLAPKE